MAGLDCGIVMLVNDDKRRITPAPNPEGFNVQQTCLLWGSLMESGLEPAFIRFRRRDIAIRSSLHPRSPCPHNLQEKNI
ncbi:hypothetical protein AVEN_204482-1 [Araneus ventricosus]|uniref:Uncharacterized protein n=1 Tax=Araneus ventricosus TaxID=182803 RepID=A0A4Y2NDP2_ARAVE|nr:hypothetical protein AVEN_204482-1 [Araneus ventricosus]